MADEKKYFRRILSECRSALPVRRAALLSELAQQRLLDSRWYRDAACVVLYAAKDNEVSTSRIFEDAIQSGRRVLFPKIIPAEHHLLLIRVNGPADLSPGAFGIHEPAGAEIVPSAELGDALICVPGVAFSREGKRLGRGGGYYDRFLSRLAPQAVTAGLAYSFQVLDRVPESPSDRRLDLIITESALHVARAVERPNVPVSRMCQGGVTKCS